MKEAGRTYNLSVPGTFDIHHLSRLRAQEYYKAVLRLLLLILSGSREAKNKKSKYEGQFLQKTHGLFSELIRPSLTLKVTVPEQRINYYQG